MSENKFGEIVLLKFPFTDSSSYKKRPALILYDSADGDVIVARVTSQIKNSSYDIKVVRWQEAGLKLPSIIRLHKIATLENTLIERKLGKLEDEDLIKTRRIIAEALKEIE